LTQQTVNWKCENEVQFVTGSVDDKRESRKLVLIHFENCFHSISQDAEVQTKEMLFPVALCGCGALFLTLKEECK
jgi:hypothetical protein